MAGLNDRKKDPLLAALAHFEAIYDISGLLAPASIRDQILRAVLVTDRLISRDYLAHVNPVPSRPPHCIAHLLVVGAGPAGWSAALRAASQGYEVLLVDQRTKPFQLQAQCDSRWVDAGVHDWPAWHQDYPCEIGRESARAPLAVPYDAHRSDRLAARWAKQQEDQAAGLVSELTWKRFVRLGHPDTPHVSPVELVVEDGLHLVEADLYLEDSGAWVPWRLDAGGGRRVKPRFAAVIVAGGQGRERTFVEDRATRRPKSAFRGLPYWHSQPFHPDGPLFDLRASATEQPLRVLVSGAGDGAIQDFVHAITGEGRSRTILRELTGRLLFKQSQVRRIYGLVDQAQRALLLADGKELEYAISSQLERDFGRIIDEMLQSGNHRDLMVDNLIALLAAKRSPPREVTLAHSCLHASKCYPINRLFSVLFRRIWQSSARDPDGSARFRNCGFRFLEGVEVDRVASASAHVCPDEGAEWWKVAEECARHPHTVAFSPSMCEVTGGGIASGPVRRGQQSHP